jgi:2',3'-cyclic-nucleotide 2'-phosphodiesterase/3'-nucleotidase
MFNKRLSLGVLTLALMLVGCQSSGGGDDVTYVFETPEVSIDESWPSAPVNDVTTLDFYAINDFHGALEHKPESNEIGINRLATYFDNKKELNPTGTVILSSGDMWQGSADSNITRGRLVTDAMNYIGFDAMALGNHEFDWGDELIHSNQARADFPFLGANIFDKRTGRTADFALPYTMIDRGGVRIGIIGTIGASLESSILTSNVINYDFVSIGNIVEQSATYLRSAGAKAVILLNHDPDVDTETLGHVDAVFNGHSHSNYRNIVGGKPVLQASYNGRAVGHVRFTYTASSDTLTYVSSTVDSGLINQNLSENQGMKAIYDQYLIEEINIIKNEVLGEASGYFSKAKLGDLAVKEMLAYGASLGAQVAFHNTGGVRDTISAGTVTYGDIYKVFPFDNELIIVEVSGLQLKWWLAQNDYVAGANRFTNTLDGSIAISDNATYKIISINYLTEKHLTSDSQYPHNKNTAINTFEYVRELLKDKWQSVGTLDPADYIG